MTATERNLTELAIERLYAVQTPCVASWAVAHGLISHKICQKCLCVQKGSSQYSDQLAALQVVFTPGSATRFGPALTELPNVEIVTYNTSNVEELDLRQAIREGQRSVGFESIRSTFGMPLHSHPLLQDVELHRNIQVHL